MRRVYRSGMAKVRDRPAAGTTPAALGEWLIATMAARRIDQVALEHLTGIDQTTISRARQGRMSDRVLLRIAQALKVEAPAELLRLTTRGRRPRGAPELSAATAAMLTGARPQRAGADVPVYHAMPHQRGPAFLLQTAVVEFAWRPPTLASCRRAFMLRMPDASMEPWRQPSEPVYCDPDRDVAQARHVLVALDTGEPHDLWLVCAPTSAPEIGAPIAARLHNARRGTLLPALPVRRAIAIIEWPDLMPA